jgi:hypothetical protein
MGSYRGTETAVDSVVDTVTEAREAALGKLQTAPAGRPATGYRCGP